MKYYYILPCTGISDANTSESGGFLKIERFVYIKKNPGTIPSILCYVSPSVELLGPTTPSFLTWTHDSSVLKPDWHLCSQLLHWYCVGVNTPKRFRQLWVKDLLMSKVPSWQLEWDSKRLLFIRKAPNLPLNLHAPQLYIDSLHHPFTTFCSSYCQLAHFGAEHS